LNLITSINCKLLTYIEMDGIEMKKLTLIALLVLALTLSACNFPGYEETDAESDDTMATEISKILTGTPLEVEVSPTPLETDVEPTEQMETPESPTATLEPEEDTPEPVEDTPTLSPTATSTSAATATLAASDPALTLGAPDRVDPMDNGDNWPTGTDPAGFTAIKFENGFLKLTALDKVSGDISGWRVAWHVLTDFYLEGTFKTAECEDNDYYGMMFRVPGNSGTDQGYLFGISCDGRYNLRRWNDPAMQTLIKFTPHDSILKGPNVVNKLGVMAKGSTITLYVNGQKITEITDSNFLSGRFGIFVAGNHADNFTAWVDQVRYWVIP